MSDIVHLGVAAALGACAWHTCSKAAALRSSASATEPLQPSPTGSGRGHDIGILHPGSMGASIGYNLKLNGARVLWSSDSRSPDTRARAEAQELEDAGTLEQLVEKSSIIISVCPPAAALSLAESVAQLGFEGIYVDANAIAPSTAKKIGAAIRAGGGTFVDGGIVGGPAWKSGPNGPRTRLYLSGDNAARIASLFSGTHLGAVVVEGDVETGASAMKIAYASWTKVRNR